jgi:TRAP-type mannitol/chloroaromatic compound transport system permease large subunit
LDNAFGLYNNLVESGGLEQNSPLVQTQNSFADLLLALKSLEIHLAERERLDESQVDTEQLAFAQEYVSAIINDLESMDVTGSIGSVLFHHLATPVDSQAVASGQALVLLDAVRQVALEMRKISESVETLAQRGRTTASVNQPN